MKEHIPITGRVGVSSLVACVVYAMAALNGSISASPNQTWITVTILTALASLTGSCVALLQASRMAKSNAQASLDLERMKNEHVLALEKLKNELSLAVQQAKETAEMRVKAYEKAIAEAAPIEDEIAQAWQIIQHGKDIISQIRELPEGSNKFHDLEEVLSGIATELSTAYRELGPKLPSEAMYVLHAARDALASPLRLLEAARSLAKEEPEHLERWNKEAPENWAFRRVELTKCQQELIRAREVLRTQKMQTILNAWQVQPATTAVSKAETTATN